ncbi:glycosyltransferase, partial [uncultured Desulfovibrio sp.]
MNSKSSHTPRVSVCMVCYNHAAFVGAAISSVLRQTFADFEFLILDNGSRDRSLDVMRSFDDARISVEALPENIHSTCAANRLLTRARGRYVALICSDDAWLPDKLARQVEWLDAHERCAVAFSRVQVMDARDRPYRLPTAYDCQFNVRPNRPAYAWLRLLYGFDNPFCCSSAMLRRSVLQECGPYDERSRNVQDLLLWTRILFRHEAHILDGKLVRMRYYPRLTNISAANAANMVLAANEAQLFYSDFFAHVTSQEIFNTIFPHAAARHQAMAERDPQLALALHTLAQPPTVMAGAWAVHRLYGLMETAAQRRVYQERYGFDILELYALAQSMDVYGQRRSPLRAACRAAAKALLRRLHVLMPLKYCLM